MTDAPKLSPSALRVVAFYVAFFAAISAPVVVGLLLLALGPQPYLLVPEGLSAQVLGTHDGPAETQVTVTSHESPEAAREAAGFLNTTIPKSTMDKTGIIRRYVRRDNGLHGIILPLDQIVLQVEGDSKTAVDQALLSLPFLRENPEKNPIYVIFTHHLKTFFWVLAAYVLFLALFLLRGSSWAGRVRPPSELPAIPREKLLERLQALNQLATPIQIRVTRRGVVFAEWRLVDDKWIGLFRKSGLQVAHQLKMRLDRDRAVVRSVDIQRRLTWSAGTPKASWSFAIFRGITFFQAEAGARHGISWKDGTWSTDPSYHYRFDLAELKKPIIEAIVTSGWTYKPVMTLIRSLGG